jgi:hypothetical protein
MSGASLVTRKDARLGQTKCQTPATMLSVTEGDSFHQNQPKSFSCSDASLPFAKTFEVQPLILLNCDCHRQNP